jgi:hypothetical protein
MIEVVLFEGLTMLDVVGPVQAFTSCRVQATDGMRQPRIELFSTDAHQWMFFS